MTSWTAVILLATYQVAYSQVAVTRQNQQSPTITVPVGETIAVLYSITYPLSNDNYQLVLQDHGGTSIRNTHPESNCTQTVAKLELNRLPRRCEESAMVTDWYVLLINGTDQVNGETITCKYMVNDSRTSLPSCGGENTDARILVTGLTPPTTTDAPSRRPESPVSTAPRSSVTTPGAAVGAQCTPTTITTDFITTVTGAVVVVTLLSNTLLLCILLYRSCRRKRDGSWRREAVPLSAYINQTSDLDDVHQGSAPNKTHQEAGALLGHAPHEASPHQGPGGSASPQVPVPLGELPSLLSAPPARSASSKIPPPLGKSVPAELPLHRIPPPPGKPASPQVPPSPSGSFSPQVRVSPGELPSPEVPAPSDRSAPPQIPPPPGRSPPRGKSSPRVERLAVSATHRGSLTHPVPANLLPRPPPPKRSLSVQLTEPIKNALFSRRNSKYDTLPRADHSDEEELQAEITGVEDEWHTGTQ